MTEPAVNTPGVGVNTGKDGQTEGGQRRTCPPTSPQTLARGVALVAEHVGLHAIARRLGVCVATVLRTAPRGRAAQPR